MSAVGRWARTGWEAFRSFDRAVYRAGDRLTAGQQWTAGLCLVFGVCLVLFGLPPKTIITPAGTAAGAAPVPAGGAGGGTGAGAAATTPPGGPPLPLAEPAAGYPPTQAGGAGGSEVNGGGPAALATGPYAVAAPRTGVAVLTAGDPSGVPGRDDASIATAFLAYAAFPWKRVDMSGDARATCAAAEAAGTIAMASHDLPSALRDCLLGGGVTVLAFDQTGTRTPSGTGYGPGARGALLSTRRGTVASLVDLARWGVASRSLRGRVGLVAHAARRADIAPAVARMRSTGLDVVATAWADGSASGAAAQVSGFVRAGVENVVLAAPVQVQDMWVEQAAAQGAPFHYVVSDADDGVTNESHPPNFDGSLAHTSIRVPWYARAHGSTGQQQQCADRWTAVATPPLLLPAETGTVYAWCEQVALLNGAYPSITAATNRLAPTAALARLRIGSPLTADLGPMAGGGWGPTQDAVLVWKAACTCWQEAQPFRTRNTGP